VSVAGGFFEVVPQPFAFVCRADSHTPGTV
jgi:hypothetical protein